MRHAAVEGNMKTNVLCLITLCAVLYAGGVAGAQAPVTAPLALGATQSRNSLGQTVVASWMETSADPDSRVTVYRVPGQRTRVTDPRIPWPTDAEQLLYDYVPSTQTWSRVIRSVEGKRTRWTYCGYTVNEGGTRFGLPYATYTVRYSFIAKASRAGSRTFGAGQWARCLAGTGGVDKLQVRRAASTKACNEGRAAALSWRRTFQSRAGGARNNWSSGWIDAAGRPLPPLNYPRLRRQQLRIGTSAVSYGCLERATSTKLFAPLMVQCGGVRFRYQTR